MALNSVTVGSDPVSLTSDGLTVSFDLSIRLGHQYVLDEYEFDARLAVFPTQIGSMPTSKRSLLQLAIRATIRTPLVAARCTTLISRATQNRPSISPLRSSMSVLGKSLC